MHSGLVRKNDVEIRQIMDIIVIKLIPSLGCSIGSLETPHEFVKKFSMKKFHFRAAPFYLHLQAKPKLHNFTLARSRDKNKGTKMCSVLALVGVDTKMKSLSRQGAEIIR